MPESIRMPLMSDHVVRSGFALDQAARGGRVPFDRDPLVAAVAAGVLDKPSSTPPEVPGARWEAVSAGDDGWFAPPAFRRGGYLFVSIEADREGTVLLNAASHSLAYVNGEPRAGDPYGYGYLALPVLLRRGANTFVLAAGRGRCRVALLPAPSTPALRTADSTLPDFVEGMRGEIPGATIVVNPDAEPADDLEVFVRCGDKTRLARVPTVPGSGLRKIPFPIPVPSGLKAGTARTVEATLRRKGVDLDTARFDLRVRRADESAKITFVSEIDGSVQYYGVRPALKPSRGNALVMTLHGASVEGIGQIDAYGSKDWATLVGPTNRRPYGFDWEDWGRLDALEVLEDARRRFPHDRSRTMLTGHSMGGHGTWALGSLYPDRFAAIGPSAGWISFATYAGGRPGTGGPAAPIDEIVRRASTEHDTLLRASNLLLPEVYVLHGDADDNVPVTEARRMKSELEGLRHPRLGYHEQPGAGHWWGGPCVDWPPMFAVFEKARLDPRPREASFTTVNPAIASRYAWVEILQQIRAALPSNVRLKYDPATGILAGTTGNVAALRIDVAGLPAPGTLRRIVIDGAQVDFDGTVEHLRRIGDGWVVGKAPAASAKSPSRSGPFKQAFRNRFVLVPGTRGAAAETAGLRAKARYDAEQFQYRGNGAVDIVDDRDAAPGRLRDRGVILYGNRDTNAAWSDYLSGCPIEVRRGEVRVGDRTVRGDDLACLFVRPRHDSSTAHVAVLGCTGNPGRRLLERLPFLTSGVAYPDWVVASAKAAAVGNAAVVAAGWFGNDWTLETGEAAWR